MFVSLLKNILPQLKIKVNIASIYKAHIYNVMKKSLSINIIYSLNKLTNCKFNFNNIAVVT